MSEHSGVHVSYERLMRLRGGASRRKAAGANLARPGGFSGKRRGPGIEIHDIRPFEDGDDLRHADAGATARTGRLHVRTFHTEEDRAVLLIADFRPFMLWGTRRRLRSVAAAEALAVVGWQAADAGARVGLLALRGHEMDYAAPRGGQQGMTRVAAHLVESHNVAATTPHQADDPVLSLAEAMERAMRLVAPGAAIVCASGLDDPGERFATTARATVAKRQLAVLHVMDAVEAEPPAERLAFYGKDGVVREGRFRATDGPHPAAAELAANGIAVHAMRADADPAAVRAFEVV